MKSMKSLLLLAASYLFVVFQASANPPVYSFNIKLLGVDDHSGTVVTLTGYGDNSNFSESDTTNTIGYTGFKDVSEETPYRLTAVHDGYKPVVVDSVRAISPCVSATVACYDQYFLTHETEIQNFLYPDSAVCLEGDVTSDIEKGFYIVCDTATIVNNIKIHPGTKIYYQQNAFLKVGKGASVHAEGTEKDSIIFRNVEVYNNSLEKYAFKYEDSTSIYLSHCSFRKKLAVQFYSDSAYSSLRVENCYFNQMRDYPSRHSAPSFHLKNADLFFKNSRVDSSGGISIANYKEALIENSTFQEAFLGWFNGNPVDSRNRGKVNFYNNEIQNSKLGIFDTTITQFSGNEIFESPELIMNSSELMFSCNKVYSDVIYEINENYTSTLLIKDNYFNLTGNSEIVRKKAYNGLIQNNYFNLNGYNLKLYPTESASAPVPVNSSLRVITNTFRSGNLSVQESGEGGNNIQFFGNIINSVLVSEETIPILNKNLITDYVVCLQCEEDPIVPGQEKQTDDNENIYFNNPGFLDDSSPYLKGESKAWVILSPQDQEEHEVYLRAPGYIVDEKEEGTLSHLGVSYENICLESGFAFDSDSTTTSLGDTLSISGTISNMSKGIVACVNKATGETYITTVDNTGQYKFDSLSQGSYLIQAVPDKRVHENLIATVYYNKFLFDQGNSVELQGHILEADFALLSLLEMPGYGNSSITGRVTYLEENDSDSQTAWSTDWFDRGNSSTDYLPSLKSSGQYLPVLVKNSDGNVVSWALTDNQGYFDTGFLPEGTYYLDAARYGYTLNWSGPVELSVNETEEVETNLVKGVATGVNGTTLKQHKIKSFPNPFEERIHLTNLPAGEEITVFTSTGLIVDSIPVTDNSMEIKTRGWAKGVYLLKIGGMVIKMVK